MQPTQPLEMATQTANRTGRRRGRTLVLAETDAQAIKSIRVLEDDEWECIRVNDVDRACWLASVRNFGLTLIVADSMPWSSQALTAIRPLSAAPILVLSPDLDQTQASLLKLGADIVLGADSGAELLRAAVQAVLRRTPFSEPALRYLEAEGLRVDLWARTTSLDGQPIGLTPTEFDVLRCLMSQSQIAVRHNEIVRAVWSWKYSDERNALRLHINRLRSKLANHSGKERYIRSVRGVGYTFIHPVSEFADDPRSDIARDDTNLLWEARLRDLIQLLIRARSREQACTLLVNTVVEERMCDGAAVFACRPGDQVLHLVAQAGMSAEWQLAVADGVPLTGKFLASDTFNTQRIGNYVDISKLTKRFGPTIRLLRQADLPAQLSLPLVGRGGVWGQLGYGRRSDSPFTTMDCMALEAVGSVLGALFAEDTVPMAAAL